MKRFLVAVVVAGALLSCAKDGALNDSNIDSTNTPAGVAISVKVATQEEAVDTDASVAQYGSRVTADQTNNDEWSFSWESDDTLVAVDNNNNITTLEIGEGDYTATSSTFTGEVVEGAESYGLIYGYEEGSETISITDDGKIVLDLTAQNGVMDDIYMAMSGTRDVEESEEESAESSAICHLTAYMGVTITYSGTELPIEGVTLDRVECYGLNSKGTIDFKSGLDSSNYTDATAEKDCITITPEEAISEFTAATTLYVNFLPTTLESGAEISFMLYFSDGTRVDSSIETNQEATISRGNHILPSITCDFSDRKYEFANADFKDESANNSYEIANEIQLAALATLANSGVLEAETSTSTFTLTENIVIERENWVPIGDYYNYFVGIFDGDGHSVSNFTATYGETYEVDDYTYISIGLFGYVSGSASVVKNLLIKSSTCNMYRAGTHVGVLAGTIQEGAQVINCGCDAACSANIHTRGAVGGLVGFVKDSFIYNCYNQGTVYGTYDKSGDEDKAYVNVGGLCGSTYYAEAVDLGATFSNCYNTGKVTATGTQCRAGGLVGLDTNRDAFTACYFLENNTYEKGVIDNYAVGTDDDHDNPEGTIMVKAEDNVQITASTLNGGLDTGWSNWQDVAGSYPTHTYNYQQ